jgi:hypothetical protein
MIACYLAYKTGVDFLCADRSFSSFSDVALYNFNYLSKIVFRIFYKKWDVWTPKYYWEANCYKVVSFDYMDNTIPYLASIKNGISK